MKLGRDSWDATMSDLGERRPVNTDYAVSLLEQLKFFYEQKLLTDVVLLVEDTEFPCHKMVLATCSSYFRWVSPGRRVIPVHQNCLVTVGKRLLNERAVRVSPSFNEWQSETAGTFRRRRAFSVNNAANMEHCCSPPAPTDVYKPTFGPKLFACVVPPG